ncbi:zinc finger, CCHC-type containing protein [Tanacetum coccineum]|uniref:Zinc finger, CCHC-type containing protein n=1 Tax=Tanacetum coccineum TaxID=301880 RepID=A0ABQ5F7M1_9ASTR
MHTRASNSKLVESLPEPESTLNRRLHRQNRRVPFEQRNNPPQHPRIVYPPILNINYFRNFLDILRNYDPMDDESMWAADRVVALTPGSAITILETTNEFSIKGNHLTLIKRNQFDVRTKTDPHKHIHEFLEICDIFKYRDTKNEVVRLMMFPLSLTREAKTWLDELNEGTIETWDELRTAFISRFFPPALFDRLLEEIRAFSQHENESLTDAWLQSNDSMSINTIIESIDAIFDENRFSSIPRPMDIIPNSDKSQRDDHLNDVPSETPEPRKSKRARKAKSYGSDFRLYLVEGSRDHIGSQYSYCYKAIDDEIGSIIENNTWVLSDLPIGCKPLGCKWIFKRKMKVNGTIDKFKARLVIQAIHNLVIHQMDVKTTFLNGNVEEEVYMKQPEGFVMAGNEHKVCKLVKSLYGLKQAPKQWHQKFDEVVLSNVIMEYLVNISKRRAFWSLNDDILKITILNTNTPYPSRKIRRIRACTHQRPQRKEAQYAVSRRPIRRIGNME